MFRQCNQIKHFTLSIRDARECWPSPTTNQWIFKRWVLRKSKLFCKFADLLRSCVACDSATLGGNLCFPKSWRVADFNKECHFNIKHFMSTKIKDCSNEREACDATHSELWLLLTVVTQHQFQDETYHGPGPGALNCNPCPYLIG